MVTVKQLMVDMAEHLPDDCTWEDVAYQIHLRRKIGKSSKDIEDGRVHSAEEAKAIMRSWFRGADDQPN
jgi:hypothetical protein